jgi:hypothetical protein
VILAQREPPFNPVQNTVDNIFDDKMAVVNASLRGWNAGLRFRCFSISRVSRSFYTTTPCRTSKLF